MTTIGYFLIRIFILLSLLAVTPTCHASSLTCRGALRVDLTALEATQADYIKSLEQIRVLAESHTETPWVYNFSTRKRAVVISVKGVTGISDSSTYTSIRSLCLSKGFVPLSFGRNERISIYNMMKALNLTKIILNLRAGSGDFFFAGNGVMSHFTTQLSTVDTDAKKKLLKYVTYSVTKDLAESVEVIDAPYTVIKDVGNEEWKYHPMVCQSTDQLTDELMGLHENMKQWYDEHKDFTVNVTEELRNLVNETKHYIREENGDDECPSVELTEMTFVPLFPFEGTDTWPSGLPDFQQERFSRRYYGLLKTIENAPKSIRKARSLLLYADLVPSRNSPWYLFSDEFHQNLKDGQAFEIMMTFSVCILSMAVLGIILCLKYYCCRDMTFSAMVAWCWQHLPSLRRPGVPPPHDQEGSPQGHQGPGPAFPMQVLSRNYHAMPPRRGRGGGSNRPGHFEITYTPAHDSRYVQRQFEEL